MRSSRRTEAKLKGILVNPDGPGKSQDGTTSFTAPGTTLTVWRLGEQADWHANAEFVLHLDTGLSIGYRGSCK